MSLIEHVVAAGPLVGQIDSPLTGGYASIRDGAVSLFITNALRLFFVAAGIMALLNFLIAGFKFINAGGDSKAVSEAWSKIWQSLLGLIVVVGSFALASLFGQLLFGRANFILNPVIYGPGQ